MLKNILVFTTILMWPLASMATNYYVSPSGSDANNGLSPATAWASINHGDSLGILNAGDTIWVSSGTYSPATTINLTRSGITTLPIVYARRGKAPAIVDIGNNGIVSVEVTADYVVIRGLTVNGGKDGVLIQGSNCQINECVLHNIGQVGLHISGDNNSLLRNTICKSAVAGIKNENSAQNTTIFGNTIYGGNNDGVTLGDKAARVFNNIIVNNKKGINGKAINVCGFNNVWGNASANYASGVTDSAGGISVAPLFVNDSTRRFDLMATAPEIDAGLDLGYPFNGSRPDIGAAEKYNVYYVSLTGNDANDGRSPGKAWRHIDSGDSLLRPGDSVIIQSGIYADSVVVTDSGLVDDPITFVGTGENCRVNGSGRFRPVRILADFVSWSGIGAAGATHSNIYVSGNGITIDRATVYGSSTYGIFVSSGRRALIQRSVLYGNSVSDIVLGGDSCRIVSNSAYSSLIGIDALSSSGHQIINNIIQGSAWSSVGIRAGSTTAVSFNDIFGFPQPLQGGVTMGYGSITANPLLVDPTDGNLHPGSHSPAIDAGTNMGLSYYGAAPDIGAYETGTPTTLSIIPAHTTLSADSVYQFDVMALDSLGNPAACGILTWSHTFASGTISPEGLFSPVATGSGQIAVRSSIGGLVDTTPVMTVVPGSLYALHISPGSAVVSADSTRQFSVNGTDSKGNPVAALGTLSWTVANAIGSIDAFGLFTAQKAGKGFVRIQSSLGTIAASDTVTVVPGNVHSIDVLPSQNAMSTLSAYQYSAFAYDTDSNFVKDLTDSVTWTDTDFWGHVSGSGLYTSGMTPGTYYVRADYYALKDSGQVAVTVGGGLDHIRIELADGTPVGNFTATTDNDTSRFYARGYLADNSLIGDVVVNWSVNGIDSIGTLTSAVGQSTILQLRRVGVGRVVAVHASGKSDSTGIMTCQAGLPARLQISPDSISITADNAQQFTLSSRDEDGNPTTNPGIVTWSVSSGFGSISPTGLFEPSAVGIGEIYCSSGSIADTAKPIRVAAGTLAGIDITPDSVHVSADSTYAFSVEGYDAKGNIVSPGIITWRLISPLGSIDSTGHYVASVTGTTRVIAKSDQGPADTNAIVIVVPGTLTQLNILPDSVLVSTDEVVSFSAIGTDAHGNLTSVGELTWGMTGDIGAINSVGGFTPYKVGIGRVIARNALHGVVDTNHVVLVTPGMLSRLAINPDTATRRLHDTLQFTVLGYDAKTNLTSVGRLAWQVQGGIGSIDSGGVFIAQAPGIGAVTATSDVDGISSTSGAITIEAINASAINLGTTVIHPGDADAVLLAFRLENRYSNDKWIDRLILHDASHGAGTLSQRLGNIDSISLYLELDGDTRLSQFDSLLESKPYIADTTSFSFAPISLKAGSGLDFIAVARVSLGARDGDSLDVNLNPGTDVHIEDSTFVVGPSNLNSPGVTIIDGMVAAQIHAVRLGRSTISPADSLQLLYIVDIPRNGYSRDTLRSFQIINAGTASESDCDSLVLFADNGNGTWGGVSEETRLGRLIFTGESWVRSALNAPLINPYTRFYVAAKIARYPLQGATFDLQLPVNGLICRSQNGGPIDVPVSARDTIHIQSSQFLAARVLPIAQRSCIPGQSSGPLLGLEFTNGYPQSVTIDTLKLQFIGSDPQGATRADLDSQIDSVSIWVNNDADIGIVSSADSLIASARVIDGAVVLILGNQPVAANGGSIRLFVQAALNLAAAKNGNVIAFSIPDSAAFAFDHTVHTVADFPLFNPSNFTVDAFPSSAISFHGLPETNLYAGQRDKLVMDFDLPQNGYSSDSLRQIALTNAAVLADPTLLSDVKLWEDLTGDGFTGDDPLIGQLQLAGQVWRLGNLNVPLNGTGNRFFITVSISGAKSGGGVLQFTIPVSGLVYASGTIGPDDQSAISPMPHLVFPSNQVTAISIPMSSASIVPGSSRNLLMAFALYNGYLGQNKTLAQITLTNTSFTQSDNVFADHELGRVSLYLDSDRNRQFDNDLLIGSGFFRNGRLMFSGMTTPLPAESLGYFFVVADHPLDLIDGDSLSVSVAEPSDISFSEFVNLNGDLPLSSHRILAVDGSVLAQYVHKGVNSRTLSPGDSNITFLSFRPAPNGDRPDTLKTLSVENRGSADTSSLSALQLWCDKDSNAVWTAADSLLGNLTFANDLWSLNNLEVVSSPVSPDLFLTGRISPTAQPNASIQLAIPSMGMDYESDNDGPRDSMMLSSGFFTISTSGLRLSAGPMNHAYTVGQNISLALSVQNRLTSAVDSVIGVITQMSDSSLVRLDSSRATAVNLAAGDSTMFHYYFSALRAGTIWWDFRAMSLSSHDSSAVVTSPHVDIERDVTSAEIKLLNSAPNAVTKGQTNIFPLSLSCIHPDAGQGSAPMMLANLRLHITDASGNDIPANGVFSRLVLATGYRNLAILENVPAQTFVNLIFDEPILIASGTTQNISLLADISETATASGYVISIDDPQSVPLSDQNSGKQITLSPEVTFPLRTALTRIDSPSRQIAISGVSRLRPTTNYGQSEVEALRLYLRHTGSPGSSPAQLTRLVVRMLDSSGLRIDPGAVVDGMTLMRQQRIIGEVRSLIPDSQSVAITLTSPITLNPGEIDSLDILAAVKLQPVGGGFEMAIPDSTSFTIRDLNTGITLLVVSDSVHLATGMTFPITSAWTSFRRQAYAPTVCISSNLPASVVGGQDSIPLISFGLTYNVASAYSPVRLFQINLRVLDSLETPLDVEQLFDRAGYKIAGGPLMYRQEHSFTSGVLQIPLGDTGLLLAPGANIALQFVADLRLDAAYGNFKIVFAGPNDFIAADISDDNHHPGISAAEGCQQVLPFETPSAAIFLPAGRPRIICDRRPAQLTPVGSSQVPLFQGDLMYNATSSLGQLEVRGLKAFFRKRSTSGLAPVDVRSLITSIHINVNGGELTANTTFAGDSVRLTLAVPYIVARGDQIPIYVTADLTPDAVTGNYVMFFGDSTFLDITDKNLLTTIYPMAEGQSYPYQAGEISVVAADLKQSFANYPNPFNPSRDEITTIGYSLPENADVDIEIFTITGESVAQIAWHSPRIAGAHQSDVWSGVNGDGRNVQPGVYFCRITARYESGRVETCRRKIAVLR